MANPAPAPGRYPGAPAAAGGPAAAPSGTASAASGRERCPKELARAPGMGQLLLGARDAGNELE